MIFRHKLFDYKGVPIFFHQNRTLISSPQAQILKLPVDVIHNLCNVTEAIKPKWFIFCAPVLIYINGIFQQIEDKGTNNNYNQKGVSLSLLQVAKVACANK